MTGYVYFIRCLDRVKIGWSMKPEFRFNKIESDSPFPCERLGYCEGSRDSERAIHDSFADLRVHREWFAATPSLLAFIKRAVKPIEKPDRAARNPLSKYIARSGKSLAKIASDAQVSRMTLYRLLKGEQNATIDLLTRVSAATDGEVPVSAFLPGTTPKNPGPAPEKVAS